MSSFRAIFFVYIAAAILLSGCANLESVGKFGAGTSAVATSFRPMVSGIEKTCVTRLVEQEIRVPGAYDYKSVLEEARKGCKPITDEKEAAFAFATVVDGYGTTLVKLSGLKADVLSSDVSALRDAASKLKSKSGDAFFNSDALGAASKLASGVVELLLGYEIKKVTKQTMLDADEPLSKTVNAMKLFAGSIYELQIEFSAAKLAIVKERLVKESSAANGPEVENNLNRAFPYRAFQPHLYEVLDEIGVQKLQIRDFGDACDSLLAAHRELINKFDEKTAPDQLALLKEFIHKARELRDSVNKL
jgi:hypothetical protein